ncbi:MAG: hypothetical protein BWZ01_02097 [Deltaproteobacteria bacterium ADurb.BinA179]|nr:MAG: hypothetical protein BWZ01_02097 [Deltaproteobacteria bacterium ADurb.BinA179]
MRSFQRDEVEDEAVVHQRENIDLHADLIARQDDAAVRSDELGAGESNGLAEERKHCALGPDVAGYEGIQQGQSPGASPLGHEIEVQARRRKDGKQHNQKNRGRDEPRNSLHQPAAPLRLKQWLL